MSLFTEAKTWEVENLLSSAKEKVGVAVSRGGAGGFEDDATGEAKKRRITGGRWDMRMISLFCLKAIFGFCRIVDNPSLSGRGYRNFLRFPNKIL